MRDPDSTGCFLESSGLSEALRSRLLRASRWTAVAVTLFTAAAFAGEPPVPPGADGAAADEPLVVRSEDHRLLHVTQVGDRTVTATAVGPHGEEDVLIELEEPPLVTLRGRGPAAIAQLRSQRRQALERVRERLLTLENASRGRRGLAPADARVVRRSYTDVFNGLAARISGETAEALRELPEVRRVVPDREVRVLLGESIPQVGADRVWNELGATGQGVTVAVIDTGIDYTHPDLGGCLGLGCRVVGGHDFVNDDADPLDDHGHGTHVAGIVAADGLVKGVAPDARLLAYKVLAANGFGDTSDVIAALELAVDPDGDPATDDAPDIVNLSLGADTGPDDPMSQAADLAVEAGLVVVASAGNSGSAYRTVEAPGNARRVLAVGAIDRKDQIATFSSRGPVPGTHDIKPDLSAPGVGIRSTVPTGSCRLCDPSGYRALNGTSMASPHVAGAAALLRELFPSWSAEQIGAALTTRTTALPLDVFTVGSGRLDAYAAATALGLGVPSKLGFGLIDPVPPSVTLQQTVTVTNATSRTGVFNLSFADTLTGALPAGTDATVTPSSLTLGPAESRTAQVEVAIDNATVPFATEEPQSYEGALEIAGPESRIHRLPLAFLKSPLLELHWDEEPFVVTVYDTTGAEGAVAHFSFPGTERELFLPPGTYDIVTLFRGPGTTLVFREAVPVSDHTVLNIERAEARHSLTLKPVNEIGEPLTPIDPFQDKALLLRRHRASSSDAVLIVSGSTFEFSDVSDAFLFELGLFLRRGAAGPTYTVFTHEDGGIDASREVTNDPADFKRVEFHHRVDPGIAQVLSHNWLKVFAADFVLLTSSCSSRAEPLLTPPFVEEHYHSPRPYPSFSLGYMAKELFPSPDGECNFSDADRLARTSFFRAEDPGRLGVYFTPVTPLFSTAAEIFPAGIGPFSWRGRFWNTSSSVALAPSYPFRSQLEGKRFTDEIPWELFQGGVSVANGVFRRLGVHTYDSSTPISVEPGIYEMHVDYTDFFVAGQAGHAEVEALFDTRNSDRSPPTLKRFEVLANGIWVDAVPPGGAQVAFTLADNVNNGFAAVALFYDAGDGKIPLTLTPEEGDRYVATLPSHGVPPMVPPVMATLELIAEDPSGNRLIFRVGLPLDPVAEIFADDFESGGLAAWSKAGPL